jgi:hypothetical protein
MRCAILQTQPFLQTLYLCLYGSHLDNNQHEDRRAAVAHIFFIVYCYIYCRAHHMYLVIPFSCSNIDISSVDCPYTAFTCDIMYCRQRRQLYYGGVNLKYCPPPQFFLTRRVCSADNQFICDTVCTWEDGVGGGLVNILMSLRSIQCPIGFGGFCWVGCVTIVLS